MGLPPGDEEVEKDVPPPTMGGTLPSWRLEELEERCKSMDEEKESDSCAVDSLILRNLPSWVMVRRVFSSRDASSGLRKLLRSLLFSRIPM